MISTYLRRYLDIALLIGSLLLVTAIYWPGLSGSWLFDDYPNIVDNLGVQPSEVSIPAVVRAMLSSPASDFKRPLASLSFAANYLAAGLDPYWMKLTNLVIHLLNGLLVFVLARGLLRSSDSRKPLAFVGAASAAKATPSLAMDRVFAGGDVAAEAAPTLARSAKENPNHAGIAAALIAASWMLLPINLTAVLYVVQRMESMANLFVLLGLIGYVAGRRSMLATSTRHPAGSGRFSPGTRGFALCLLSITVPTALGLLAKETAVMLPLYALLVEWMVFHWRKPSPQIVGGSFPSWGNAVATSPSAAPAERALPAGSSLGWSQGKTAGSARPTEGRLGKDWRVITLFLTVLVLPMVIGLGWLLPSLLKPEAWATRDFTLDTRLLSETRIVVDYIHWTLLPTLDALSFYHDDFRISTGLLAPWSTLASLVFLVALVALMLWLRKRQPLVALGIALFLSCQLLTSTILPLELIYEHRNYFASFGLLLAIVPLLAASRSFLFARLRYALLLGLMLCWATLTAMTAYAWGNPLRLAHELASRAPQSPRAQYELGRTYIIDSRYDPSSRFTQLAYAPLEKAAALPNFSILPEQALIFMNARMQLPLKDAWWDSIVTKLKAHPPGVQDESALASLTQCARDGQCVLPPEHMKQAFVAALSHPAPTARLLATYGDYAWNVLGDHALGTRMTEQAVKAKPDEPAYRITLIRMLVATGRHAEAVTQLQQLAPLNIGGRLDAEIAKLKLSLNPQ